MNIQAHSRYSSNNGSVSSSLQYVESTLRRLKCIQKTIMKFDTVTPDAKVLGTKLF